jgi:Na+/H+-dicarboxylate symporter
MGINPEIVDVSIPLLVNLNKGGVAMIAALKIVFIYSVLGMEFTTETFLLTMLISVLSAIIVGGVPGGAFRRDFYRDDARSADGSHPNAGGAGHHYGCTGTLINVIHDLNAAQIVERFAGKKQIHP